MTISIRSPNMDKETKNASEQVMAIDQWLLEFTRRATPRLRAVMQDDESELPTTLKDALERLRQSEYDGPKR